MKVLVNSISGREKEEIIEVNTLKEFKDLVYKTGCTLIDTNLCNPNAHKSYVDFHLKRLKGCEISITLHDTYIE